jgi:hypothetical protein
MPIRFLPQQDNTRAVQGFAQAIQAMMRKRAQEERKESMEELRQRTEEALYKDILGDVKVGEQPISGPQEPIEYKESPEVRTETEALLRERGPLPPTSFIEDVTEQQVVSREAKPAEEQARILESARREATVIQGESRLRNPFERQAGVKGGRPFSQKEFFDIQNPKTTYRFNPDTQKNEVYTSGYNAAQVRKIQSEALGGLRAKKPPTKLGIGILTTFVNRKTPLEKQDAMVDDARKEGLKRGQVPIYDPGLLESATEKIPGIGGRRGKWKLERYEPEGWANALKEQEEVFLNPSELTKMIKKVRAKNSREATAQIMDGVPAVDKNGRQYRVNGRTLYKGVKAPSRKKRQVGDRVSDGKGGILIFKGYEKGKEKWRREN